MLIEGPMMNCAECPTCHVFTILNQETMTRTGPGEPGTAIFVVCANPFCRGAEFDLRDTERRVFRVTDSILRLGYFDQGDITEGRVQEPNHL